jgi:hypothetical protein
MRSSWDRYLFIVLGHYNLKANVCHDIIKLVLLYNRVSNAIPKSSIPKHNSPQTTTTTVLQKERAETTNDNKKRTQSNLAKKGAFKLVMPDPALAGGGMLTPLALPIILDPCPSPPSPTPLSLPP